MVIKVKYNGEWVKIPYLSDVHGEELVTEAPKDDNNMLDKMVFGL